MSLPFLSIVIVNWNSRSDLHDCLASLYEQNDKSSEIIVVDNGSSDQSVEMVHTHFPEVTVIETLENLGFAEACNRGIAAARHPWVFTLNNDTVTDFRLVEEIRYFLKDAPDDLGIVQAKMLFKDNPEMVNSTGVVIARNGSARDRDVYTMEKKSESIRETFCACAGAAVYRRSMLDSVALPSGVFDRNFFMYFEDVDLGWRCRLSGWKAVYLPSAVVYHTFHGSTRRRGKHFIKQLTRKNRVATLMKNASIKLILTSSPKTFVDIFLLATSAPQQLKKNLRCIRQAYHERIAVTRLSKNSRKQLELEWVGKK